MTVRSLTSSNPNSCFSRYQVNLSHRPGPLVTGLGIWNIAEESKFILPERKRILIVDPHGDDAASCMWNLLSVMAKKERNNTVHFSHVIADFLPELGPSREKLLKERRDEAEKFAGTYGSYEFLDMNFPFPPDMQVVWQVPGEVVSHQTRYGNYLPRDVARVSGQLKLFWPDIIFMPHFRPEGAEHPVHQKVASLYLTALARMIASEIGSCQDGRHQDILAKTMTIYFYESYHEFDRSDVIGQSDVIKPNVYNLTYRPEDLRKNLYDSFKSQIKRNKKERTLDAMAKNLHSLPADHQIWGITKLDKSKDEGSIYFERFVEHTIEVQRREEEGAGASQQKKSEGLFGDDTPSTSVGDMVFLSLTENHLSSMMEKEKNEQLSGMIEEEKKRNK